MKENIIQFDSYLLCNLIMTGITSFTGTYISGHTNLGTKTEIKIEIVADSPTCVIPWTRKINLSSRFLNRPFRIGHPALKNYSFVMTGFELREPLRVPKVPLLYKMLYKLGMRH